MTALVEESGRVGLPGRKWSCRQSFQGARGAGGRAGSKSDGFRKRINRVREVSRQDGGPLGRQKTSVAKTVKPT